MELGSVVHFLENRTILVTGATGFLAKIFVEKILRVQPNVKKLYLLLRASDAHSASQRLHNEASERIAEIGCRQLNALELISALRAEMATEQSKMKSAIDDLAVAAQKANAEAKKAEEECTKVIAEEEKTKHVDLLRRVAEE
ncbi:hypothetical protein CsSME_00001626 [Camellia sinensis var. sinensis]